MRLRQILILLLVLCAPLLSARTVYNTVYNSFASLLTAPELQRLDGDKLVDDNVTATDRVMLDTVTFAPGVSYFYAMRFSSLHNDEGKTYAVTDGDGNHRGVSEPAAGIVFNVENDGSCYVVSLTIHDTHAGDEIRNVRQLFVRLWRRGASGSMKLLDESVLTRDVDLRHGLNAVQAAVRGDVVTVSVGEKRLQEVMTHEIEPAKGTVGVGYFIGSGAKIGIERTMLKMPRDEHVKVVTEWTRSALDERFARSTDPYEGYWTYLDRDMEDTWLKLGGRYTVAVVATDAGYDIIYIDGAQVEKSQWQCGELKGRLASTIFHSNFSGYWIDATHLPFGEDVYGTFESGVIMTIKFPVYKSQIRFSKVLDP